MTIIDALVAEHRVFLILFDQIEAALPGLQTTREIGLLARMLAGLLHAHGGAERDLAYITLDHILHRHHRLARLHHDHQELDELLLRIETVKDLPKARSRFKAVLRGCRAHFDHEEQVVFPLMAKALQPETLEILGRAWQTPRRLVNAQRRR